MSISPHTPIHLAGHRGLVGSAIRRALEARGHHNLRLRTHAELDLTDRQKVRSLYAAEKPQAVILAAAKVGGILANWEQPYEFIQENLGPTPVPCACGPLMALLTDIGGWGQTLVGPATLETEIPKTNHDYYPNRRKQP